MMGIIVSAKNLTGGFDARLKGGDWTFVLFIFQGILFVLMGYSFVKLDEIASVNIKLFEIQLKLKEGLKTINPDNLEFENLKRIKEKFSGLSTPAR